MEGFVGNLPLLQIVFGLRSGKTAIEHTTGYTMHDGGVSSYWEDLTGVQSEKRFMQAASITPRRRKQVQLERSAVIVRGRESLHPQIGTDDIPAQEDW